MIRHASPSRYSCGDSPVIFLKNRVNEWGGTVTDLLPHFGDFQVAQAQQFLRLLDAAFFQIFGQGHAAFLFEQAGQKHVVFDDVAQIADHAKRNRRIILGQRAVFRRRPAARLFRRRLAAPVRCRRLVAAARTGVVAAARRNGQDGGKHDGEERSFLPMHEIPPSAKKSPPIWQLAEQCASLCFVTRRLPFLKRFRQNGRSTPENGVLLFFGDNSLRTDMPAQSDADPDRSGVFAFLRRSFRLARGPRSAVLRHSPLPGRAAVNQTGQAKCRTGIDFASSRRGSRLRPRGSRNCPSFCPTSR